MSEARTLIWDLDGTILDSLGILESGLGKVLPSYNLPLPDHETMSSNFHGSLEESIDNALGGLEKNILHEVVQDFLKIQDTEYEVIEPHIFPDVLRLAGRARAANFRQVLITNRAHEGRLRASPRSIVANSELRKYIDVVICGDDSEHRKPWPEVLGPLARELDNSEITVVGDQHVDAEFARNLQANSVLVCRDGTPPPHLDSLEGWQNFVTIVHSLDEVELL